MIHCKDLLLKHVGHADGSSGGFVDNRGWRDLYLSKVPVEDRLMTRDAYDCGFGYEGSVFPHDCKRYNEDGSCKDPDKLLEFLQKSVFLRDDEFNYDSIETTPWL
jgi:hypothetical protein